MGDCVRDGAAPAALRVLWVGKYADEQVCPHTPRTTHDREKAREGADVTGARAHPRHSCLREMSPHFFLGARPVDKGVGTERQRKGALGHSRLGRCQTTRAAWQAVALRRTSGVHASHSRWRQRGASCPVASFVGPWGGGDCFKSAVPHDTMRKSGRETRENGSSEETTVTLWR